MKRIGISIDYSNICKDYNTSYLDRDNTDPATSKCMKEVVAWIHKFLSELLEKFKYSIHHLHSSAPVKIEDIASKRFLFYSLEKDITLQNYVLQNQYVQYESFIDWKTEKSEGVLIKNDEDGEGIYIYFEEKSKEHLWIKEKLSSFSLDEAP